MTTTLDPTIAEAITVLTPPARRTYGERVHQAAAGEAS